eukprot:296823-Amphidinium_carterae.1
MALDAQSCWWLLKDVTSRCCFRVLQALMGPQGLRASDSRQKRSQNVLRPHPTAKSLLLKESRSNLS